MVLVWARFACSGVWCYDFIPWVGTMASVVFAQNKITGCVWLCGTSLAGTTMMYRGCRSNELYIKGKPVMQTQN